MRTKRARSLIFFGGSGVGKTTAQRLCACEILNCTYDELVDGNGKIIHPDYMELNASGDRGIAVMQGPVTEFAKLRPTMGEYKVCGFSEAEGITDAGKAILKDITESLAYNCCFIFTTNNLDKLIKAQHSRSTIFYFDPISYDEGIEWLIKQCKALNMTIAGDIAAKVYAHYKGDLRSIISDFLIVYQGEEIKKFQYRPSYAEQIFKAKDSKEAYLKLATKEHIDVPTLLRELLLLNDKQNVDIFARASMACEKGDPMIAALLGISGLVKK